MFHILQKSVTLLIPISTHPAAPTIRQKKAVTTPETRNYSHLSLVGAIGLEPYDPLTPTPVNGDYGLKIPLNILAIFSAINCPIYVV